MSYRFRMYCSLALAVVVPMVCGFSSQIHAHVDEPILVTAAPAYEPLAALKGEERFPNGAKLMLAREGTIEPLAPGFFATADANVSFDATHVLFAGKQNAGDPWQLWELTLVDRSVREVIAAKTDLIRPLYLPGGRLVYARKTPTGFQLEAASLDGLSGPSGDTNALRLTYAHASAVPVDVLQDGRILFEANYPLGSGSTPELFLVYSDGSGVESYRCDHGPARWGGKQLASGDVIFTHGASMARFTSPLATEVRVAAPLMTSGNQYAGPIAEMASGAWLLSERDGRNGHFKLSVWGAGQPRLRTVLERDAEDLVEPVLVTPRPMPNRHPSALHDWTTANLLALDSRQSRDGSMNAPIALVKLEAQDILGHPVTLGTSPVEADGSFFVKVPGDKPIRFSLLDKSGNTIRQEHGWFWIRSGEQRICVGCHVGPERAPENQVPAVLLRTTIPVDLSGAASSGGH
jgi:hypothetical protein